MEEEDTSRVNFVRARLPGVSVELVKGIVSLGIPDAKMPPSNVSESKILQFKPRELIILELKFAAVISAIS
jgi:hypothetical protein